MFDGLHLHHRQEEWMLVQNVRQRLLHNEFSSSILHLRREPVPIDPHFTAGINMLRKVVGSRGCRECCSTPC